MILIVGFGKEAQAQDNVIKIFKDSAKGAVTEPTTYAPGVLYFTAKKLDWSTSQIFFRNGYVEVNPDFTISGKANDVPISYSDGNKKIITKTIHRIGLSALNNTGANVSERFLVHFYPEHEKLIGWICRIEKMVVTSYLSLQSRPSFNQWQENKKLAIELNLK